MPRVLPLTLCCVVVAALTAAADHHKKDEKKEEKKPECKCIDLLAGGNLSAWQTASGKEPPATWQVNDGVLSLEGKGSYIWTKEQFGDFQLTFEFKTWGNSGVFFRTGDPMDPVQTGLEMQVHNPSNTPSMHSVGALYDARAPAKDTAKMGEWNKATITAKGPELTFEINGEVVIEANLDDWDTPGKNPDGSKNKYKKALKDFPRKGHIGLQDHGAKVMFRDIEIKPL